MPLANAAFVGRVSTRHVGLKSDLQGLTYKYRQERNTTIESQCQFLADSVGFFAVSEYC